MAPGCSLLAALFLLPHSANDGGPRASSPCGCLQGPSCTGLSCKSSPQALGPQRPPLCPIFSPTASALWGPGLLPIPTIAESHFLLLLPLSREIQIHGMHVYFRKGRHHACFYSVYQATSRAVRGTLDCLGCLVEAVIHEHFPGSADFAVVETVVRGQSMGLGVGSPGFEPWLRH